MNKSCSIWWFLFCEREDTQTFARRKPWPRLCRWPEEYQPEMAILDVMLPDGDGFSLLERLKQQGRDYPILFLTARGEENDRFRGYELGADDYVVKPFLPRELLLKVSAILRRSYKADAPLVRLRDSQIDFERGEAVKEGKHIPLTAKEHDLLLALCRNAGKIVTHRRPLRGALGRQSLWL